MPVNMVIRNKRKEIGLTQEQVAEYLGVSTPAVNKWEKGATYPDISLLSPLARLLKMDLNTLLCFDAGLSKEEIGHFTKEIVETIRESGFESGFAMGMEKVREYPNCANLVYSVAITLEGSMLLHGADIDDKEPYQNQIIALYERAAKSDDDEICNRATYMLVSKYINRMEYDKAQEMLDRLPERRALDKRHLQANLWIKQNKLSEAAQLLERKLIMELNEMQCILVYLADIEMKEGNTENASHLAELAQKATRLFDLWEYTSFIAPLQVALAQENVPDSIFLLKSMLSAALMPWDPAQSPLYRHIPPQANKELVGKRILPTLLSEIEKSPQYAFLHANTKFQQMVREYHAKC